MSKSSGYISLDKNLVIYLPKDRPYTELEAMFSFTNDLDNNRTWSINGYSKQWGWSRNKVRYFVNSVRTVAGHLKDSQRTSVGQAVHLINNNLEKQKDSQRTSVGQSLDSRKDTTIKTKTNTKTNIKNIFDSEIEKYPSLQSDSFLFAWSDWEHFRTEKKKPLTPKSIKEQIRFLSEQPDPVECIRQSIRNDYQGIFKIKGNNNGNNGRSEVEYTPEDIKREAEERLQRVIGYNKNSGS